jgi:hypothetical protein
MEAEGVIHRGYKTQFDGALHWWINSQRAIEQTMPSNDQDWTLVKPDGALCQPVDEARFLQLLSECLAADFFTTTRKPLGDFGGAMLLQDEWWNRVAIGEFADHYYATYWFTGA